MLFSVKLGQNIQFFNLSPVSMVTAVKRKVVKSVWPVGA